MKKNKQNTIEDIFRKKMENHEVRADFSDWDIIHKQLHQQTIKTKKWIQIWSSIAALITLTIISLSIYNHTEESQSFTQYSFPIRKKTKIIQASADPIIVKPENIINEAPLQKQDIPDMLVESLQSPKEVDTLFTLVPEINKDQDTQLDKETETSENLIKNDNSSIKETDFNQQKTIYTTVRNKYKIPKRNQQGWLLASSFGTNSVFSDNNQYSQLPQYNNTGPEPWSDWGGGYLRSSKEDDWIDHNADITHLPPFSFGLTVRKKLSPRFGIETGVIYTYLSSTYKWERKDERYKATQQLHYIGIPINGIVTFWDNAKWSTYASAGFMVEKGIRRKVDWDKAPVNPPSTFNQNKNIDGLQWSVNGSIGLNYKVARDVGVYFEPRLSYYFKNNQPKSIRTDCPVSAGFGIGVQYSF